MRNESDAALVARLRAGDEAAFTEAMLRYRGRMLAVARRILPQEEDALDAVQDAWVSAFRKIDGFAGQARLSTWLHRVTVNAALMRLRSLRRVRGRQHLFGDAPGCEPVVPCDDPLPMERAAAREELDTVLAHIERLPAAYRTVLKLRVMDGMGPTMAARRMGRTPSAVKVCLHRARVALFRSVHGEGAVRPA